MGRITTKAIIGGKEELFLVDTGGDLVAVESSIYNRTVKKTLFTVPVITANGTIKKRVGIGTIKMGGCDLNVLIGENLPGDKRNRLGSLILQDLRADIQEEKHKVNIKCPYLKNEQELLDNFRNIVFGG